MSAKNQKPRKRATKLQLPKHRLQLHRLLRLYYHTRANSLCFLPPGRRNIKMTERGAPDVIMDDTPPTTPPGTTIEPAYGTRSKTAARNNKRHRTDNLTRESTTTVELNNENVTQLTNIILNLKDEILKQNRAISELKEGQ